MAKYRRRKKRRRDPEMEMRDWPGQPIRHKRASVLGWQKRLAPRRPKKPTFMGHRPVKSSAKRRRRDTDMRDWPGEPLRHKWASELGWRRKKRRRGRRRSKRDVHVTMSPGKRDWPGAKRRHRQASARGWRLSAKKGWRPQRRSWKGPTSSTAKKRRVRRDTDFTSRDWRGDRAGHAKASALGWRRHASSGWRPKRGKYKRKKSRKAAGGSTAMFFGRPARIRGRFVAAPAPTRFFGREKPSRDPARRRRRRLRRMRGRRY